MYKTCDEINYLLIILSSKAMDWLELLSVGGCSGAVFPYDLKVKMIVKYIFDVVTQLIYSSLTFELLSEHGPYSVRHRISLDRMKKQLF